MSPYFCLNRKFLEGCVENYQISIFNDVLGPVMTGPSSSHTAGPGRIGYFIHHLMRDFDSIKITFPQHGSYAGVYKGQKSDVALVAGLLGLSITDARFRHSLEMLQHLGIHMEIYISSAEMTHPNASIIELFNSKTRAHLAVESWSTGGGMFEIRSINGFPVQCRGDTYELFFQGLPQEREAIVSSLMALLAECRKDILGGDLGTGAHLLNVKLAAAPDETLLQRLRELGERYSFSVSYVPSILPVCSSGTKDLPFDTADSLKAFLGTRDMPLWKAAALYESVRSGWTEAEVLRFAEGLARIMKDSILQGLEGDFTMSGFLSPTAAKLHNARHAMMDMGLLQRGIIYSTAVMENNSAMGQVAAAPTAGSCGVIPGVLFGVISLETASLEEAAKALLCAGLVGVFIAKQATFAAEVGACQAEIGAASCMSAALVGHFLGSDVETSLKGASMALQNMLGLVCDPVAGCVDIPCINRNAMAVGNAVISANMVQGGFDPVIPLDQTIQSMFAVGNMLPRELRCTGLGGLCCTQKAQELSESLKQRG